MKPIVCNRARFHGRILVIPTENLFLHTEQRDWRRTNFSRFFFIIIAIEPGEEDVR